MEEERYEVLGNVKAQKNAVYEQWLDGAYVKVGRTARDLVPDVQAVARLRKYPGVDDFTAKGLSAFLSAKKGDRNSQVASYERERVKYWTVAPRACRPSAPPGRRPPCHVQEVQGFLGQLPSGGRVSQQQQQQLHQPEQLRELQQQP